MADIAPEMADFLILFAYGEIFSRPFLSPQWKEFIMIASSAAKGTMNAQLKVHLRAALNVGCSKKDLIEVMYQIAVYAGFPAALNGLFAITEVFEEQAGGSCEISKE